MLIASHGAGLVNMVFLPDHAGVIEIMPYMIYKETYQRLAASMGMSYSMLMSNLQGERLTWHFMDANRDPERPRLVGWLVRGDMFSAADRWALFIPTGHSQRNAITFLASP